MMQKQKVSHVRITAVGVIVAVVELHLEQLVMLALLAAGEVEARMAEAQML